MFHFKIKNNLHLTPKGEIISFETVVGQIENDKIVEFGKFSRTTSRHITYIRDLTKLPVFQNFQKPISFWKFDLGVKCKFDGDLVGPKSTNEILKRWKDLEFTKPEFIVGIWILEIIKSKKDKKIFNNYFDSQFNSRNDFNLEGYLERMKINEVLKYI